MNRRAGLDPLVTAELYETVRALNRQQKVAVVMISHDLGSAMKYAGKILHLQNKQRFFGSVGDYRNSSAYRELTRGKDD